MPTLDVTTNDARDRAVYIITALVGIAYAATKTLLHQNSAAVLEPPPRERSYQRQARVTRYYE
jgi:hypothetical protein